MSCLKKDGTPLSVYSSQAEAADSARYQKAENRIDLYPYQCDRCGLWHLSPVNGRPNQCGCTDSKGDTKYLYPTREAAQQQAEREASKGCSLRVYACPEGKGYHLTHTSGW